eukprot:TRINITY_DN6646_c0_g1_i8.p4 TRINITY_DN6646_c0_g1~~TRINITY_DN6646_c0_g1_i8.p4  ORF type:complete len:100 (-),score=16.20 TRINITY_DN6646_c0_g1_i8:166-465(-)
MGIFCFSWVPFFVLWVKLKKKKKMLIFSQFQLVKKGKIQNAFQLVVFMVVLDREIKIIQQKKGMTPQKKCGNMIFKVSFFRCLHTRENQNNNQKKKQKL